MTEFSKWKVPPYRGGEARRNKLLVSWRPLVIAAPLAGSLLAPLRCGGPCSSDAERLGHLQNTHTLRKLLSDLAFDRAVYLRSAELHALSDGALETCLYPLADHCPLSKGVG